MRGVLLGLALAGLCVSGAIAQDERGSYVVQHIKMPDGKYVSQTVPYEPRAGDLILFDEYKLHWTILYKLVGSEGPHHSCLVFRRSNGEFCTVEAGPNDTTRCRILPLLPRLQEFKGTLHIRRLKTPISKENEEALAQWAEETNGKRYAAGRLCLQVTPIRVRGPLRREWFGATYTDRNSYMCAELAVAGGTVAGIFDSKKLPANAVYPRDIIYDDHYDLRATHHEVELWSAYPLR